MPKRPFLSQPLTVAEKEPVMAVPTAALIEAKGENIVFLVQDGKIIQKPSVWADNGVI